MFWSHKIKATGLQSKSNDYFLYDGNIGNKRINQFQPSAETRIETSLFICITNQMTGFYMKYNTWLKSI